MVSPPEFFVFVVVLECGIEILGSQVELTESHDRVPVRGDVILAPINSLHKGMRVSRIWFHDNIFLQRADSFVRVSLFHQPGSFDDFAIGGPCHFGFDGFVDFVLEPGIARAQSGERSKNEAANVRPVRHSRMGTKQRV